MVSRILNSLALRRKQLTEKEKGFTLIELLVVVIIIGILAAIAIPVYLGIQGTAKDSAVQSDISNAKTAVVAYSTAKNGTMPANLAAVADYGFTTPAAANYSTTAGSLPVVSFTTATGSTGFCIQATSVTGTVFGASDLTGVAKGTCANGVFTAATP